MEIVSSGLVDNVTNLGDLKKTKYIKINLLFNKGKKIIKRAILLGNKNRYYALKFPFLPPEKEVLIDLYFLIM